MQESKYNDLLLVSRDGGEMHMIKKEFIDWCPLLSVMFDSGLPIDKNEEGAVILDIPERDLKYYCDLVNGNGFPSRMNSKDIDSLYESLHYLLYVNKMEYPKEAFVRLLENKYWLDNYRKHEDRFPFCGLQEVPYINERLKNLDISHIPLKSYVAGSYAMYLAGWIDDPRDCDIFSTDKKYTNKMINKMASITTCSHTKYTVTCKQYRNEYSWSNHISETNFQNITVDPGYTVYQYVLTEYDSPAGVIFNFDIDCCQVLFDPFTKKLFASHMAIFANSHKTNYFDPWKLRKLYIPRLVKYECRGYNVFLPFFEEIVTMSVEQFKIQYGFAKKSMSSIIRSHRKNMEEISMRLSAEPVDVLFAMKLYRIAIKHVMESSSELTYKLGSSVKKTAEKDKEVLNAASWKRIHQEEELVPFNDKYYKKWLSHKSCVMRFDSSLIPNIDKESIINWYKSSVYCIKE